MSDSSTGTTAPDSDSKYVAEYVDGPLAGTTEHRFLSDGQPQARITQIALVEGTDAMFDYIAGEHHEVNGEQFVKYSFDAADSDSLEGRADQDAESKRL